MLLSPDIIFPSTNRFRICLVSQFLLFQVQKIKFGIFLAIFNIFSPRMNHCTSIFFSIFFFIFILNYGVQNVVTKGVFVNYCFFIFFIFSFKCLLIFTSFFWLFRTTAYCCTSIGLLLHTLLSPREDLHRKCLSVFYTYRRLLALFSQKFKISQYRCIKFPDTPTSACHLICRYQYFDHRVIRMNTRGYICFSNHIT